ncbi:MAG TPA: hypothetical protein DIT04_01120 [Dysgonomonas sp.]|nr:hypothetical protein [Dysgonomonas sp.]
MAVMKILLVEDDENLAFMLSENLEIEGYEVTRLTKGEDVIPMLREIDFGVVLMDVDLGGERDGFDIAETVRKIYPELPIIFTTGKTHFRDTERGLRIGYVDYQKKPFGARELISRLTNLVGRKSTVEKEKHYVIKGFSFYPLNHLLYIDNVERKLTKSEAAFLTILCENLNNVVKKDDLTMRLWGDTDSYPKDHSMNNLTHRIRKYLEGNHYVELKTISKVGYRLVEK